MRRLLDAGTAIFALVAAAFWFLSAYGNLPPMVTYWDSTPESDPFYQAVKFSARMNTYAALASGVSAGLFGVRNFIDWLRPVKRR
jgi:hypothetical protein